MMLLPMLTGTVATAMMFAGRQGGTYAYVVGAVFGVSSLGMLATSFGTTTGQPKKAEMMAARREYLRHLAALRRKVREHADRQRDGLHYRHPDPTTAWSGLDRKSTRLNSSHSQISYAVFCLKKKKNTISSSYTAQSSILCHA